MRTARWVRDGVERIESNEALDRFMTLGSPISGSLEHSRAGHALRGDWLGHALHPVLTDVPIGCWISATLLDLVGGRRARSASRSLVGIGILASIPTAAAGFAEVPTIRDTRTLRVVAAHSTGNTVALIAYLMSWRSRRRGHHFGGTLWALAGGGVAGASAYLGGHLSYARRAGTGERGRESGGTGHSGRAGDLDEMLGVDEAARLLQMPEQQFMELVDHGVVAPSATGEPKFRRSDVLAARLLGG